MDLHTNTEADAARYEAAHADADYDDRPALSDLPESTPYTGPNTVSDDPWRTGRVDLNKPPF